MATQVFLYPSISSAEQYGLKVLSKGWSLLYHNSEGEPVDLRFKPAEINSNINCVETDGIWSVESNDLCLNSKIVITHYRGLFGPAGIACRHAKLGVSVIWTSADSRQRGSIKAATFGISDADFQAETDCTSTEIDIELDFLPATLRGDLNCSVVIYVAEPGNPEPDEKHLANEYGLVLGEINSFTLRLDGNGSLFPVYEVYEKEKPLWFVNCDWIDPLSDSFSESISININKAHKNYRFINQSERSFCKQLLVEIMTAAICCIIEETRNSEFWDQIIDDDSSEHGSVAEAIRYFQNTLGWDLSSPRTVSESARDFFDRRMAD